MSIVMLDVLILALSLQAWIRTTDMSSTTGILYVLAISILILATYCLTEDFAVWWEPFLVAALAAIFSILLFFDTQMLASEGRYGVTLKDFVVAAMILQFDLVIIFFELMILCGKGYKKCFKKSDSSN